MQDRGSLSVGRIVAAAIDLADEDGLAAVSMARVAKRLGFTTMALYRHVAAKDELLALMLDAALVLEPEQPASGWREGLEQWAWQLLRVVRRHPWWLQIPVAPPPTGPNTFALMERGLRPLGETALSEPEKAGVILLVNGYVMWQARLEVELTEAGVEAYRKAIHAGVDEQAPHLKAMVDAGTFDDEDDTRDEDFAWGLSILMDGIDAKVALASRRGGAGELRH
jgi:AcrR family transcriptional regulator